MQKQNSNIKPSWFILEEAPALDLFLCYPVAHAIALNTQTRKLYGDSLVRILIIRGKKTLMCFDEGEWERVGAWYESRLSDVEFLSQVNTRIRNASDELDAFVNTVYAQELIGVQEARHYYQQFLAYIHELYTHAMFYEVLELGPVARLSHNLETRLANYIQPSDPTFKETMTILTTAEKPSWVQKERIGLLAIAQELASARESGHDIASLKDTLLNKHTHSYFWIPSYTSDDVWDVVDFDARLNQVLNTYKTDMEDVVYSQQVLEERQATCRASLGLSEHDARMFSVVRDLAYLKDYRRGIQNKAFLVVSRSVLAVLADKTNLTLSDLRQVTFDEYLQSNVDELARRAEERRAGWYYCKDGADVQIGPAGDAPQVNNDTSQDFHGEKPQKLLVQGVVASRGGVEHMTGRVKIVTERNDVKNFTKGDILVSHMTNPDIIEAMVLAGAIVTDMGGLTCHAAIVARELNKPCIIGTRTATKQLHDGQIVSLDLKKGIIHVVE